MKVKELKSLIEKLEEESNIIVRLETSVDVFDGDIFSVEVGEEGVIFNCEEDMPDNGEEQEDDEEEEDLG